MRGAPRPRPRGTRRGSPRPRPRSSRRRRRSAAAADPQGPRSRAACAGRRRARPCRPTASSARFTGTSTIVVSRTVPSERTPLEPRKTWLPRIWRSAVLGERPHERVVGPPDHPAEEDELDRGVVAQDVEHGQARGDDGDRPAAQLLGEQHRRGPDVEDDAVAVGDERRGPTGDRALVAGVGRGDLGEAPLGVGVGARRPADDAPPCTRRSAPRPLELDEVAADRGDADAEERRELLRGAGAPGTHAVPRWIAAGLPACRHPSDQKSSRRARG